MVFSSQLVITITQNGNKREMVFSSQLVITMTQTEVERVVSAFSVFSSLCS